MKTTKLAFATCLLALAAWGQQPAAKPEIITTANLESLQRIVQGMGFEVTWDKDKDGKPEKYFTFRAEGYRVIVQVPDDGYFTLVNIFTEKVSLDSLNEWNYNNSFAYAAKEKKDDEDVYFATEVIVSGGVTRENIEEHIKAFRNCLSRWARFVIDHEEKPATKEN